MACYLIVLLDTTKRRVLYIRAALHGYQQWMRGFIFQAFVIYLSTKLHPIRHHALVSYGMGYACIGVNVTSSASLRKRYWYSSAYNLKCAATQASSACDLSFHLSSLTKMRRIGGRMLWCIFAGPDLTLISRLSPTSKFQLLQATTLSPIFLHMRTSSSPVLLMKS
jgi:hypothetical protein